MVPSILKHKSCRVISTYMKSPTQRGLKSNAKGKGMRQGHMLKMPDPMHTETFMLQLKATRLCRMQTELLNLQQALDDPT